ncbi:MAG TPA: hypothetical protein VHX61_10820 [Rhizomicrobium sp.]|jgi:hypothetical protein|nr:hypothetical protein [Rhizomicrobium sp.]
MKKALIVSAVLALGAVAIVAVAGEAIAQRPPPGTYQVTPQASYAFFAASQPANSNKVGIFVARRKPNAQPELFYCSSPADAASKDRTDCRSISAFPK